MAIQPIEQDIRERAIAWANNSLYGSLGFFLSMNGGPADEHHLDRGIEDMKQYSNKQYHRILELEAALRQIAQPTYGTEPSNTDAERADIYWGHLSRFQRIAREALPNWSQKR